MRAVFAVLALIGGAFVARAETSIVRCESLDGTYAECRISLPGKGTVVVQRELSRFACTLNQTWGVRGKTIWVTNGCRALFRFQPESVGATPAPSFLSKTIRCESDEANRKFCPANTLGGVELVKQLSIMPCTRDQSWGVARGGIWVDAGCRADFRVGFSAAPPPRPTVTCESSFGDRVTCPADTRYGVRLSRRLSKTDCVLYETWGYDRRGVWVADGCRAQFTLGR